MSVSELSGPYFPAFGLNTDRMQRCTSFLKSERMQRRTSNLSLHLHVFLVSEISSFLHVDMIFPERNMKFLFILFPGNLVIKPFGHFKTRPILKIVFLKNPGLLLHFFFLFYFSFFIFIKEYLTYDGNLTK